MNDVGDVLHCTQKRIRIAGGRTSDGKELGLTPHLPVAMLT